MRAICAQPVKVSGILTGKGRRLDAETASTAGTSLWDSTAPDGTRGTDVAPLPTLGAFPGEAGSCPLYRNKAVQLWLQYHGIILFLGPFESPKGRDDEKGGWWTSRSGTLAWPQRKCLGVHPHQLVHSSDWWGDRFMFPCRCFFFLRSGPEGKFTSSFFGFLPLQVPSEGWTTGSCQLSTHSAFLLRPLLSSQWSASSGCFFCRLYVNFSCFLCFPAWYSANLGRVLFS